MRCKKCTDTPFLCEKAPLSRRHNIFVGQKFGYVDETLYLCTRKPVQPGCKGRPFGLK